MMQVALDPDEDFIEAPFIAWPGPTVAQAIGKVLAELATPPSDGLIRDYDTPLRQEEFNATQAQTEHMVQPNRVADDLPGKPWRY
jgi:hypothetical protein